ncbi:hypothetical protein [Oceanibium sediminis]|uniref:hypothetical protein n=1 Tax=Oceanibium sediminis TaxID=2026339 RepID=UPI0013005C19|nr:hypothetical protein [Oceanibium sediminis]
MDVTMPEGFARPVHLHERAGSRARKPKPMKVRCSGDDIPVAEWWGTGFSTDAAAPRLSRGNIEILVGGKIEYRGLAYTTGEERGRRSYAFKHMQDATQAQPLDYPEVRPKPTGLITQKP